MASHLLIFFFKYQQKLCTCWLTSHVQKDVVALMTNKKKKNTHTQETRIAASADSFKCLLKFPSEVPQGCLVADYSMLDLWRVTRTVSLPPRPYVTLISLHSSRLMSAIRTFQRNPQIVPSPSNGAGCRRASGWPAWASHPANCCCGARTVEEGMGEGGEDRQAGGWRARVMAD